MTRPAPFAETEADITLHGLGFLQLKLGGNRRLHVWHPDLPRRACFEHSAIHDHRFSFTSRVLVGEQCNIAWNVCDVVDRADATHVGYLHEGPRTAFGNRPWIANRWVKAEVESALIVPPGESYDFGAFRFHSTAPGGDGRVATVMTKTWEGSAGAHSLCAVGVQPDADFDRAQWSEARLWGVANEVVPDLEQILSAGGAMTSDRIEQLVARGVAEFGLPEHVVRRSVEEAEAHHASR